MEIGLVDPRFSLLDQALCGNKSSWLSRDPTRSSRILIRPKSMNEWPKAGTQEGAGNDGKWVSAAGRIAGS